MKLYYDVKVKRYPMALGLVKPHKQPKGLGRQPVPGPCFFTLYSQKSREPVSGLRASLSSIMAV